MTMTKDQQAASATTMAAGVRTVFSAYPFIYVNGAATAPAEAATKLDFYASLRAEVDRSKAAYENALDKENQHAAEMTAYMGGVTRFVRAAVGNDPALLVRFGIPPIHPRTPQTVEEKAAAIAKRGSRPARRAVHEGIAAEARDPWLGDGGHDHPGHAADPAAYHTAAGDARDAREK